MNTCILADSGLLNKLHMPADKSECAQILKILQTSQHLQQLRVDQSQGLKQSMVSQGLADSQLVQKPALPLP